MTKIKLLRNTIVDGEHVDAHQIAQCSDDTARTLISMGKAIIIPDGNATNADDVSEKAAAKAAKKPVSKSALHHVDADAE